MPWHSYVDRTVEVPSSRVVIIEGIYALSEKLRPLLDLRVSVTGGVHFDLVKRVLRDIQRAGQEPEEIIQQISETVLFLFILFFRNLSSFWFFQYFVGICWTREWWYLLSFTGLSNVQSIHRARPANSTHKNRQQVQSVLWFSKSYIYFEGIMRPLPLCYFFVCIFKY